MRTLLFGFLLFVASSTAFAALPKDVSDQALVSKLAGFQSKSAEVNGIHLHYVEGGTGETLLLVPGWPQTWWEYHKIMPALAEHFHVISVDLRGMGSSSRPKEGYDKKTMAKDLHELIGQLGLKQIYIAGHDIGSMTAFAFAANYPEATKKLIMMDVPHPDESWMKMPILPQVGKFGVKIDDEHPGYPWWFAFHQVEGLPEQILLGRMDTYINFLLDYLTLDSKSISSFDRKVYTSNYATADAIRAGDAWYQAFSQDVLDLKSYAVIKLPVLAIGGSGYGWLKGSVPQVASNAKIVKVDKVVHFMAEENPDAIVKLIRDFVTAP